MNIGPYLIGPDEPLFVIAELGLNHDGSLDTALALVDRAAAAGASAVKLQTLRASELVVSGCPSPPHVHAESLCDFLRRYELDEDAHRAVVGRARARGLAFISTPLFDDAIPLLERVGCDAYKIASGDLTHHALVARAAATGKPLILSTGMSELEEVVAAVKVARDAGASQLALLHCVSSYPTPDDDQNLRAIRTLDQVFDLPVGLSDHGTDEDAVTVAVALGAVLYERHFVLGSEHDALDRAVSMTPAQLERVVRRAARVTRALGTGHRACTGCERSSRAISRRGLYARRPIAAGAVIGPEDIIALRPDVGVAASAWRDLVGGPARRSLAAGEAFVAADLPAASAGLGGSREVA